MRLLKSLPKLKRPRLLVRRVVGDSMSPTLEAGRVIVAIASDKIPPRSVVIFRHHQLEKVKRVTDIKKGKVFLVGDNLNASTDSRDFGWVERKMIMAKVVWPRV